MQRLLSSLLMMSFAAFAALPVGAQPADGGHARVQLVSERAVAVPGETVYLGLHMEMDPDWHVYWRNAGDAGLPPQILWEESPLGERTEDSDFVWPLPQLLPVIEGEIMDYGYNDQVTFPFAVDIPDNAEGSITFRGTADYLICKDICIPESAPVSYTLDIGETQAPDMTGAGLIGDAIAAAPEDFAGEARVAKRDGTLRLSVKPDTADLLSNAGLRFFPFNNEIVHSAPQTVSSGPDGATLDLAAETREPLGERLEGVLALTRPDGTRTGYRISAAEGAPFEGTFGTAPTPGEATGEDTAGMSLLAIAGLALLGGMILNLMPCVLPVLSIKALGMVNAAASGETAELRAHGIWYTAGVLVFFALTAGVFVALRTAGEFVNLGFQLQYPAMVAALALVMFLIGLWLAGLFDLGGSVQGLGSGLANRQGTTGAFFTGILAGLVGAPCVGPFLGVALGAVLTQPAPAVFAVFLLMGFGLALPFLALSFVPGLQRLLPKPGAWMERLKQAFAFPMFLTAVWLLSVLHDQAGPGAVIMTLVGAVLIGFGIWAMTTAGGRIRPAALGLGALALVAGLVVPVRAALNGTAPEGGARAYGEETTFSTQPWSPERVDSLLADGKGVFVDFTATWCMTCQANKRTTLKKPDIRQAMADANIAFLVADFTNKDPAIAAELEKRGRAGVPMYLLYGPGAREPEILPATLTPGLMRREIAAVTE